MIKNVLKLSYFFFLRIVGAIFPFRGAYFIAGVISRLAFIGARGKRRMLQSEVERLFPGSTRSQTNMIVKRTLDGFFQTEMEVYLYPRLNKDNIRRLVKCVGVQRLEEGVRGGRGTMLLFAHFGANQMVMPAVGYMGYRMCQMSAPATVWIERLPEMKSTLVERMMLRHKWRNEQSLPVKHINIFGSLREAFMCLKRNEFLGIAIDGGGGKDTVEVDFLGRKACFPTGAIDMALRTGCCVLPVFMLRNKDATNTMIIDPPLEYKTGTDKQADIRYAAQLFVNRLEQYVLSRPCHYMYFLAWRSFMVTKGDTPLI
ncbi:lipid A biosynthesis acyltransferase, homology to CS-04 and Magnetobacterium casensis [Candidatus Magnetobacterium bavaricum]|uniref:Lipid A biosynthesis acyltransferase, homology to CS-04 and Magnetobacterium casensis n=1 Tax=Candidatus Magnetobacterium bavaricum TaxID=29290 RepID=A0A0F3GL33_9BACT|nr:lipid A biosynthesis acyltransferase, homology to CS-04 and Magnetobacterium casensis [Candidatus Magnetobacterium bavaricum]